MSIAKLSALAVKQAKPADKPYKLSDGGMFLLVDPKGAKYWRLGCRFDGKQKLLALGTYPKVTLEQARRAREHTDPAMVRPIEKLTAYHHAENNFEAVAREWHGKFWPTWTLCSISPAKLH